MQPANTCECLIHTREGGQSKLPESHSQRGLENLDPRKTEAGDGEWTCSRSDQNQVGVLRSSHGSHPGGC